MHRKPFILLVSLGALAVILIRMHSAELCSWSVAFTSPTGLEREGGARRDSLARGQTGVSVHGSGVCVRADLGTESVIRPDSDKPSAPGAAHLDHTASEIASIRTLYGVTVHTHYRAEFFFCAQWRASPILADGSELCPDIVARAMPPVREFLSRYPVTLIRQSLSDIYLLRRLSFYGLEYGGTNRQNAIWATDRSDERRSSAIQMREILHHEFSSILCAKHEFPWREWQDTNVPNWEYLGRPTDMLKRKDVLRGSDYLMRKGFLAAYSQASIEEDFNLYAEWLFEHPDQLTAAASRYERVRRKMALASEFYRKLNVNVVAAPLAAPGARGQDN